MSWFFPPYVSAAQRRAKALKAAAKMSKAGRATSPVQLLGRKIAATFWGKAWCENLESYSDYDNRLPRGRTYVRNGSVLDLQMTEGKVVALVSGSELYKISISIKPLTPKRWKDVQKECGGKIDSLIELLQGRLSAAVMAVVTHRESGLFPKPSDISLQCSCPDWADMCKHVAASLYGVGARLDQRPDLLFLLRGVDPAELISATSAAQAIQPVAPRGSSTMAEADLSEVFGIELEAVAAAPSAPSAARKRRKVATQPAKKTKTKRRVEKSKAKKGLARITL